MGLGEPGDAVGLTDASEEPIHLGFLSLPVEIQDACMAEPEPSGRTRIEIVADDLDREVQVDYDADMAYFQLLPRRAGQVARSVKIGTSVIADYTAGGELVGAEVFLVNAAVLPATVAYLQVLLR